MSPLICWNLILLSLYDSLSICKTSTEGRTLIQRTSYIGVPLDATTPVFELGHETLGVGCSSGWE